jgi:hypothetical protein
LEALRREKEGSAGIEVEEKGMLAPLYESERKKW